MSQQSGSDSRWMKHEQEEKNSDGKSDSDTEGDHPNIDVGTPLSNFSGKLRDIIRRSRGYLISEDGIPRLTSATSSPGKTAMVSGQEKESDFGEGDKRFNDAIQGLAIEFRKGVIVSTEICNYMDVISHSPQSKQLANPVAALKLIEAHAGPGRSNLAYTLAASCQWGIKSLLGAIQGMEAAVICVTSSSFNTLHTELSSIFDSMQAREKETMERAEAHVRILDEATIKFNKQQSELPKLTTSAETLLLTLQDVQNKALILSHTVPQSVSSAETQECEERESPYIFDLDF